MAIWLRGARPMWRAAIPCVIVAAFPLGTVSAHAETCMASFYDRGRLTANGERFNPWGMTAAHLRYPFNTRLRVTDLVTRRSVIVRVSDRGPAKWTHHCLDLTRGAARRLGFEMRGVTRVLIERL